MYNFGFQVRAASNIWCSLKHCHFQLEMAAAVFARTLVSTKYMMQLSPKTRLYIELQLQKPMDKKAMLS
jgi:arginine/ornithine N-succinyltransferase beta subunit